MRKAENRENFLANFFNDCSSKLNTYQLAIDFLKNFEEAKFLVQSLEKEENSKIIKFIFYSSWATKFIIYQDIMNQVQERMKSATDISFQLTITHRDGQIYELVN